MERGQGKPSPYERFAAPPSCALRVNFFLSNKEWIRLRTHERCFERDPIPNDTPTHE